MRRACRGLALVGLLLTTTAGARSAEADFAYGAYQAGHYRRALAEALKRIETDSQDAAAMTRAHPRRA